jgi:hypothetical protein
VNTTLWKVPSLTDQELTQRQAFRMLLETKELLATKA